VGLVGFPNVGKSTLLSMVSNAKPKVANYHFTTLTPILGVVDLDGAGGFVMADIPGLIEGAAEGLGLGHEFLAHIERTKVLIHVVDASGSEGRDPIEDIIAINKELAGYNVDLTKKHQIIAANKMDLVSSEEMEDPEFNPVTRIRAYLDAVDPNVEIYPISAATGQGIKELLYHVSDILASLPKEVRIYEQEFNPEEELAVEDIPFTIERDPRTGEYHVEGPRIEKMLGYTNLETEKGFLFLQKFIEDNGIVKMLKDAGCKEGDTVRMYGHAFDFYE
jgi:GTP-binding protein